MIGKRLIRSYGHISISLAIKHRERAFSALYHISWYLSEGNALYGAVITSDVTRALEYVPKRFYIIFYQRVFI